MIGTFESLIKPSVETDESNLKEAVLLLVEEIFKEKKRIYEEKMSIHDELNGLKEELHNISKAIENKKEESLVADPVDKEETAGMEKIEHNPSSYTNMNSYYESIKCPKCGDNVQLKNFTDRNPFINYTCKCGFTNINLNRNIGVNAADNIDIKNEKLSAKTKFKRGAKRVIAPINADPFDEWKRVQNNMLLSTIFSSFGPIYEYMRKNYGIVWEQIKKDEGIKSNKGLLKIIYRDDNLRSIFSSSLSNMTRDKNTRFNPDEYVARLTKKNVNTSGNKTIFYHMDKWYNINWDKEIKDLKKKFPDVEDTKLEVIKHNNKLKCYYISTAEKLINKL